MPEKRLLKARATLPKSYQFGDARPEAVGDGETDDTAAIQAAIDSGRGFHLKANHTYRVSSTIVVTDNGFTANVIEGEHEHFASDAEWPPVIEDATVDDSPWLVRRWKP